MKSKITVKWLKKNYACKDDIKVFCRVWGRKAPLTLENLKRAVELQLDIRWLARCLLRSDNEALKVFDEAADEARRFYDGAIAEAYRVHQIDKARWWEINKEATHKADRVRRESIAAARWTYKEVRGEALWEALKAQDSNALSFNNEQEK